MNIHRSLIAIAGTVALCACDRPSSRTETAPAAARVPAEEQADALVRVIHAHPSAPQADVYAGDRKAFSDVGFGTVTTYRPVSEAFTLAFKPAGQPEGPVMMESKAGMKPGQRYTVLAELDRDLSTKIDLMSDDAQAPSPGKALVRIVHAAPEAGPVNVFAADTLEDPILSDINYGAPARYQEVPVRDVTVRVAARSVEPVSSETQRPSALVQKTDLEAGKVYTLVITPGNEPGKPVQMLKVEDSIAPAQRARDEVPTGKQNAIQREP